MEKNSFQFSSLDLKSASVCHRHTLLYPIINPDHGKAQTMRVLLSLSNKGSSLLYKYAMLSAMAPGKTGIRELSTFALMNYVQL